ncbi:hypothetical protein KVT40_006210 [Elsinoe batatas]|uniref:Uncharacterized protein n=1 Tax=Elsinoe batatas TaxID=2601811 RepID=A0A8K0KZT7_9PEZI|nr:hypothetical protein KVT40_006210 [Elsinoe batatas]
MVGFRVFGLALTAVSAVVAIPQSTTSAPEDYAKRGLNVRLSIAGGLLSNTTDGRVHVLFAPAGTDPLEDTEVDSSPDKIFGKNVFGVEASSVITLSGGSSVDTDTGVYGWPNVSLNQIPAGSYSVQAFLTRYETAVRSDGSKVSVRFPCGDGGATINGPGSLTSVITDVQITGRGQTVELKFTNVTAPEDFTGSEIGGCNQGNYEDIGSLKHLKIRSEALSKFWGRDMYVGANIRLPPGYTNSTTRYPVVYEQDHWTGGDWWYSAAFTAQWDSGIIPATSRTPSRPTPKFIHVTFRHEAPFYDDSYAVNTANIGPYGDAINDEMIPLIDSTFRTIAEPYARVQEGGSTGGWISAASLAYRPDLFGACFSSYPDSLSFIRHQAIPLYTNKNAYFNADGSSIPSIRTFVNDTEVVLATTQQENHWELSFGTSTRSFLQWDVWQAVFSAQGYNNYPLEAWDKYTGDIYPGAVELWKPFDLAEYITSNWASSRNLGEVLKNRMFIYVGGRDTYYLNLGVQEFQKKVEALGGPGWANFTYLPTRPHGGVYNNLPQWEFFELMYQWIQDHAPDGKTPLDSAVTTPASRGNGWEEVLAQGGRAAAKARQADPEVKNDGRGKVTASVGRWDPGVKLEAQWVADRRGVGRKFEVTQGQKVEFKPERGVRDLALKVTGTKRGTELPHLPLPASLLGSSRHTTSTKQHVTAKAPPSIYKDVIYQHHVGSKTLPAHAHAKQVWDMYSDRHGRHGRSMLQAARLWKREVRVVIGHADLLR